jgi:hypothetical protein
MPAIQALLGSGKRMGFTIRSTDFSSAGHGSGVTNDGTNGFTTGPSVYGVGNQEYIIQPGGSFNTILWDSIYALYVSNRLTINNSTGYVFNVAWGPGSSTSSGKAMLGIYFPNGPGNYYNIQLSPIDTNDGTWQTGGQDLYQHPLAAIGTFNFPATFTLYRPIISNPANWYC